MPRPIPSEIERLRADTEKLREKSEVVLKRLWPIIQTELARQPPVIQGAVLADMVALWVAGHVDINSPEATARLQQRMILLHAETVAAFTELYDDAFYSTDRTTKQ